MRVDFVILMIQISEYFLKKPLFANTSHSRIHIKFVLYVVYITCIRNFFSAHYICDFLLDVYPFDVQRCEILLELNEKQMDTVR
jgi:hypothetical protein